jgi:hypothetical protein
MNFLQSVWPTNDISSNFGRYFRKCDAILFFTHGCDMSGGGAFRGSGLKQSRHRKTSKDLRIPDYEHFHFCMGKKTVESIWRIWEMKSWAVWNGDVSELKTEMLNECQVRAFGTHTALNVNWLTSLRPMASFLNSLLYLHESVNRKCRFLERGRTSYVFIFVASDEWYQTDQNSLFYHFRFCYILPEVLQTRHL